MARTMWAFGCSYGAQKSENGPDALDDIANNHLKRCLREYLQNGLAPPQVLDLGAGDGDRAERYAGLGAAVTAVDFGNHQPIYDQRNARLEPHNPIRFICKDARDVTEEDLGDSAWSIIHVRRVIHFLPWEDVEALFAFIKKISHPGTRLVLSFHPTYEASNDKEAPAYPHPPQKVRSLLHRLGYKETNYGMVSQTSCQLFMTVDGEKPSPASLPNRRTPGTEPHNA